MRIVEQTSNQLRLEEKNDPGRLFFSVVTLFFGGFSLIPGLLVISMGVETTLTCQKIAPNQGSCQIAYSDYLFFFSFGRVAT